FYISFFLQSYSHHRHLHSFPTRRSSDLIEDFGFEFQDIAGPNWLRPAKFVHGQTDRAADWFEFSRHEKTHAHGCRVPSACGKFRSEEHTSELQSRGHLVCRLLLEKKKNT